VNIAIFISLFLPLSISVSAQEVYLQCDGRTKFLSWEAKNWSIHKSSFEISFNDTYGDKLTWRGIRWCEDEGEFDDTVKIEKYSIKYECNALNNDPDHIPSKIHGWFNLNRKTGKFNWQVLMTSKRNHTQSFKIKGYGICKEAYWQF
jgi:hypothetical protein